MTSRRRDVNSNLKRLGHGKRRVKELQVEERQEKQLLDLAMSSGSRILVRRTISSLKVSGRKCSHQLPSVVIVAVLLLCLIALVASDCSLSDLVTLVRLLMQGS